MTAVIIGAIFIAVWTAVMAYNYDRLSMKVAELEGTVEAMQEIQKVMVKKIRELDGRTK